MEMILTKNAIAKVDDNSEYLNVLKWHVLPRGSKASPMLYAVHSQYIPKYKSPRLIYMHRFIMEHKLGRPLLKTEEIDHIDHDGLNNTISNLRITTHQQNSFNRRKNNIPTSSKYQRITWDKQSSKWSARIIVNGKRIYLGRFLSEYDAAKAVDIAARKYYGEHANLNFPEE
jgi:hypothetical protein